MKSLVYLTATLVFGIGMITCALNLANQLEKSGENTQLRYEAKYEAYK
jgi:hypothetical protein